VVEHASTVEVKEVEGKSISTTSLISPRKLSSKGTKEESSNGAGIKGAMTSLRNVHTQETKLPQTIKVSVSNGDDSAQEKSAKG